VKVTVLGSSPVLPNPGQACSGYLVESDGHVYLVDCGAGVLSRLLCHVALPDLGAVLISHTHPDHCLDLVHLRQALVHGPGQRRATPLPVYVGPGTMDTFERLGAVFDDPAPSYWEPWIAFRTFDPDTPLDLPGLRVRFAPTLHYVPCWAMRFEHAGRLCVYTADTGPSDAVADLARDAHVLIAEASLLRRDGLDAAWGHLSAAEAGRLAAAAGAERLVLTHYFIAHGPDRLIAEAHATSGRPVRVAREGEVYEV